MNRETKAAADERWAAEQALQRREAMDRERDASRAAVAQAEAEERAKAAALADAEAEAARIAAERKREERQAEHRKKTEEQEKARADAARKRAALAELQRRAKAGDKGAAATLRALNAAEAKRRDEALAAQHAETSTAELAAALGLEVPPPEPERDVEKITAADVGEVPAELLEGGKP